MNSKNNFKNRIFFFSVIVIPILFLIFFNFLGGYFFHDTLDYFRFYKYIFVLSKNGDFPMWTPKLDFGLSTFYMYLWTGNLGLVIIKISHFLNLNSYFSFNLYIYIALLIFLFGIFLNLKSSQNGFIKFILFCSLYFGASLIYRQLAWDLLAYLCIPYVNYWSNKYARSGNFKNINKIILSLLLNYLIHSAYLLIYTGYISIIIFLTHFLFHNFKFKIIKKKITIINKVDLFILIFLLGLLYYVKNFQMLTILENYNNISPLRKLDGIVSFETFSTYANFSILNLLDRTLRFNNDIFDFQFYINPYFLSIMLILFLKDSFVIKKEIYVYLLIGLIIIFVFFFNFYAKDIILYNLPFFKYTRHLNLALIIAKPIYYLCISILIIDNLNFNKNKNFYFKKLNAIKILNNNRKIIFFILCFCFYLENFFQVYNLKTNLDDKTYLKYYKTDKKLNANYNYTCIENHELKYKDVLRFPEKTRWNHMPISVNLITEEIPCVSERRQEFVNSYKKDKININNSINFYILDNKIVLSKLNELKPNEKNLLQISFSDKWKVSDKKLQPVISLENHSGFLSINLNNKIENKEIQIVYDDYKFKLYLQFQIVSGLIILLSFLFIFYRSNKI